MRASTIRLTLLATLLAVSSMGGPAAAAASSNADAVSTGPAIDTDYALVQLNGDPLSTFAKTRPPRGKKIDFGGSTVKAYRAQLSALRNDFKSWLRTNAPAAKVTGEYDISLNAVAVKLNGTPLVTLSSAPQVKRAEYQGLYYPTAIADPDLALIHATEAWAAGGGSATAGAGVKVAIVDSGIDTTHLCFADAGYAAQTQLGDRRFTNNKVIVAKVFNNKTPSRDLTAEAIGEHGTHVSGTVACNAGTAATADGATIPYGISGVAPRALLGNYNVFPGDVASARSEDILNALDAAYSDGFDVANMSLGGGASGIQDLLTVAVDDLDQANMVVAVAAGNSGPGHFTVESPGSAARALTAGAASVGHFVASPIVTSTGTYAGIPGEFGSIATDLSATFVALSGTGANGLATACSALSTNLAGKVAMIARGTCTFSVKVRNVQAAGAIAVVVSNNAAGDPIAMGQDGTAGQPTIPAYMVSLADGAFVKSATAISIGATNSYFLTGNDDIMAGFSSQGPTDVDFRVKPDVVAPGVNVLSSIPHAFCAAPPCFAFFQGTSMATPHLAGAAAVVRGAHTDWSAAEVRSAIVNTADQGVLKNSDVTSTARDVLLVGAGRANLLSAVGAQVALDPVSVSFGGVPSGSGQTLTFDVAVKNLGGSIASYTLGIGAGDPSVGYAVSPSILTLAAGTSGTVTVTMVAAKGAAPGGHQTTLTVTSGTEVAHAAVYTLIK